MEFFEGSTDAAKVAMVVGAIASLASIVGVAKWLFGKAMVLGSQVAEKLKGFTWNKTARTWVTHAVGATLLVAGAGTFGWGIGHARPESDRSSVLRDYARVLESSPERVSPTLIALHASEAERVNEPRPFPPSAAIPIGVVLAAVGGVTCLRRMYYDDCYPNQ